MKPVIIYYTNNQINKHILHASLNSVISAKNDIPLIVTAQDKIEWYPHVNIVQKRSSSHMSMYRQIVESLDIAWKYLEPTHVYFCEHDVLYPNDYFSVTDETESFIYSQNKDYYDIDRNLLIDWPGNISLSTMFCPYWMALSAFIRRVYRCKLGYKKAGWTCSEPGKSRKQGDYKRLGYCTDDTCGEIKIRETSKILDIRSDHNLSKFHHEDKKIIDSNEWSDYLKDLREVYCA